LLEEPGERASAVGPIHRIECQRDLFAELQAVRIDHGKLTLTRRGASKRSTGPPVALTEVLNQEIGYRAEQISDVDPVASESGNEPGSVDLTMAAGASGNAKKIVPCRLSPLSAHEVMRASARPIAEKARLQTKKIQIVLCDPLSSLTEEHRVLNRWA
jgi:hypothetical protein